MATTSCPQSGLTLVQTAGPSSGNSLAEGVYEIEYEATDACNNSSTCSFSITVLSPQFSEDYCNSESDFPWHDYIGQVQLNTLDNISGKSTYSDFTSLSTELNREAMYGLALTTNFSYFTFEDHWKIWIDYNQNNIFEEPSEIAFSAVGSIPPDGTSDQITNGNLVIPATANLGETRMRVSMKRGSSPSPCEILPFGEVEDYTVIIGAGTSTNNHNNSSIADLRDENQFNLSMIDKEIELSLFPNPASHHITLSAEIEKPGVIYIYDHFGRIVKTIDNFNGTETLSLSDLPAGLFAAVLKVDQATILEHFIITTKNNLNK